MSGGKTLTDIVKLPARMDLSAAPAFVAELTSKDFSGDVTLDASDVNQLGMLCAQAMIAAARSASAEGGKFALTNVNEKVEEQLACLGLTVQDVEGGAQ